MKKIICYYASIFCIAITAGSQTNVVATSSESELGRALFQHNVYNFASSSADSSHLDFYVSFVNDILQFVKKGDSIYTARYDLAIALEDQKHNPFFDKFIAGTIQVSNFAETNSRFKGKNHRISFIVPPGEYIYNLQLTDRDTKQSISRTNKIIARSFAPGKLHLSDVIFADRLKLNENDQILEIEPNLSAIFKEQRSDFMAFALCYPAEGNDSIRISHNILTLTDNLVDRKTVVISKNNKIIPIQINLRDCIDVPGHYWLKIRAIQGDKRVEIKRRFVVEWQELQVTPSNMELVIEQLRIIADNKEVKVMKEAAPDDRVRLFESFWGRRDPTPGTAANELKDEFFRRIDFANRNFISPFTSHDGWSSDRGRIYIKYGEPTQVERQPTEMNTPAFEIWYYDQLHRRFVFSDPSGTGDYRLIRSE